ncbi:MAG: Proprotein convertase in/kexin type 6 [Frankiales bacterium]|nr:Proprotein convertase in/kexin type 6 [Frankiales bacterium]
MDLARRTPSRTAAAAGLALLAVLGTGAGAVAGESDLPTLPGVLSSDLSWAEESALDDVTGAGPVTVGALVAEGSTARVVTFLAGDQSDAARAIALLADQPSVLAADVDQQVSADLTDHTGAQWGNRAVRSVLARSDLSTAELAGVTVAVLDTGVDITHPDLAAAAVAGHNVVDPAQAPGDVHGHGTHVAGTIAAAAGNGGIEGIAPGVRLMPVKVLDDAGSGWSSLTATGIIWAADHGADVINMSLGGTGEDNVQKAAVQYARGKGVVVIASAGNAGQTGSPPSYPAAYPGVIGVGSTTSTGARSAFSSFGAWVDIAAPGSLILSTRPGGAFVQMSGTSMAAPHIAGVAALVRAAAPGLTPDRVEAAMTGTATDAGTPGRDDEFGAGIADAPRAVAAGRQSAGLPPGAGTPGPSDPGTPAPAAGPTLLAMTTTPSAVIGKPTAIVGVVASASSTVMKGISATLEATDSSGTWIALRTAKTGGNGLVSFPALKPVAAAFAVRVVVAPQPGIPERLVNTLTLPVVAPVAVRLGRLTSGTGLATVTSPFPTGAGFVLQHRPVTSKGVPVGDGAWTSGPGSPTVVNAAKGLVSVPVTLRAGVFEVRAVREAGPVVGSAISPSIRVTVR